MACSSLCRGRCRVVRLSDAETQWDRQGEQHTRDGGMDAGLEHQEPQHGAEDEIGCQALHPGLVHPEKDREHGGGPTEHRQRQVGGVESRDDEHRAKVVDDGEGGEEDLERDRDARPEQGEHTEREGDVGGGRDRPAAQCLWRGPVDGHVDQRRDDHAAERRDAGQDPVRPGPQAPVEDLALDLQADQQEEHRHQTVVDPVQDAEAADIGLERGEVRLGPAGVRDGEGQGGARHQDQATGCLTLQDVAKGRDGTG